VSFFDIVSEEATISPMNIHTLLDRWLSREIITEKQYKVMLTDIQDEQRDTRSGRFTLIVSVLGALLL